MMTMSFVFKATLVLLAGLLAARLARRSRAAVRHVLLASSFAMLVLLPVAGAITPSLNVPVPRGLETAIAPMVEDPVMDDVATPVPHSPAELPAKTQPTSWQLPSVIELLSFVWIAGALVFVMPVLSGLWQVRALRRSALPWRHAQPSGNELARVAGIRRQVPILLNERLAGPMTCGIFRPAIVLPKDATTWSTDDVSRALVHELEHVRRCDWLTQCAARIVAAMYWFHPIVWVAWRQFALEAERACDDAVLCERRIRDRVSDETEYADQLVHLAERLSTGAGHVHLAMANRRDLSARVTAVLDSHQRRGRAGQSAILGAALLAAAGVAIISPLQLVAASQGDMTRGTGHSRFEVASIKPCLDDPAPPSGTGRQGGAGAQTVSPDRVVLPCVTVDRLIAIAYVTNGEPLLNNLPTNPTDGRYQWIKGLPEWVLKEKFTIEAKAAAPTDDRTLRGSMLATLLEERFKLKLHRDFDEVPVYALTVSKGGLRIAPEPCVALAETTRPADAAYTAYVLKGGQPNCGTFTMALGTLPGTRKWVLGGETMAKFAGVLSGTLDRRVIDRTGLTGEYNIRLEFFPDEHTSGRTVAQAGGDVPPDATGPNMFAALEAQLGLKLEPTKAQRGLIVVDSIDRPRPDRAVAEAEIGDQQIPLTEGSTSSAGQDRTRFEAATIKPCLAEEDLQPGRARGAAGGTNASISPGRFSVPCVTLEQLIYLAYASYGAREEERLANDYMGSASDSEKIRGGPDWVHSHRDKWAIEATAPGVTDRTALMGTLLRTLLEERFKLKTHRESERVPMYALRVAKSGVKLKAMKEDDCDSNVDRSGPPQITPGGKQPCGFMTRSGSNSTSRMHFVGFAPSFLARQLADVVHIHVIDETGITDNFIIDLTYASEDAPPGTSTAPSLFTALEQQLGLKLEKTSGPRGYIVVDRAERPTPDAPLRAIGAGR